MTEVQQKVTPLHQTAKSLAGQVFDVASRKFIEELSQIGLGAADRIVEALEAVRDNITGKAASEIEALQVAGDEESLKKAIELVANLRNLAEGAASPEVQKTNTALEQTVTAETILSGFKKLADGVIEITRPVGLTMQQAGEILNIAAKSKDMEYPVFYEGDKDFWQENEADPKLQTIPGTAYKFTIPTDSVYKTRDEQERKYGQGAPLAALALAEACERLITENEGSLFKDANGNKVWVRGSAAGLALYSSSSFGVFVSGYYDDFRNDGVAFAAAVPARN